MTVARARRPMPWSIMPRSIMRRPRIARGFTLLEILVVVTLIAALSLILVGAMTGGMDGLRMRSAAKELVAELRFARAQAIATGTVQTFSIVPAQRTWTGAKGRHGDLPKSFEVVFTGVRQVQSKEGEGVILFFEDGASTGGQIQLRRDKAAWNIDVTWLTGEVALRRNEAQR